MCLICANEEELTSLGYPKVCSRDGCGKHIGLHDDSWTRADIMHDNRVGMGTLTLCSHRCTVLFYCELLRTSDVPIERALATQALAYLLVVRGNPVTFGNSGFCLYCSAQAPVSVVDVVRHFDDCPWEALRKAIGLSIGHNV